MDSWGPDPGRHACQAGSHPQPCEPAVETLEFCAQASSPQTHLFRPPEPPWPLSDVSCSLGTCVWGYVYHGLSAKGGCLSSARLMAKGEDHYIKKERSEPGQRGAVTSPSPVSTSSAGTHSALGRSLHDSTGNWLSKQCRHLSSCPLIFFFFLF